MNKKGWSAVLTPRLDGQMTDPWRERVEVGDAVLYLGDCREILPTLGKVDAVEPTRLIERAGIFWTLSAAARHVLGGVEHQLTADILDGNREPNVPLPTGRSSYLV